MANILNPALRRRIIEFDPADPDSPTIEEFCRTIGISRHSFYNIRKRHAQEGLSALHPISTAPKHPHRTYDPSLVTTLIDLRATLKKDGWDYGPASIRDEGIERGLLTAPVPSVSTIARMLRQAGVVERNPKKRPKRSILRFSRDKAMVMWQLDAMEYRLFDDGRTKVTIYQLIDDATRFDVGTAVFPDPENTTDALRVIKQAIADFGAPHELLSDNSKAFNRLRSGTVGPVETYLASMGTMPISGNPYHPQTQGKNERAHQTLSRYLNAHQPQSIDEVKRLLEYFRERYNYRRPHQGIENVTPAVAWDMVGQVCPNPPIDLAVLQAKAQEYALRSESRQLTEEVFRQEENPGPAIAANKPVPAETVAQLTTPHADGETEGTVTITTSNQKIFYQGMKISVPRVMANRPLIKTVTSDELAYWDAKTGELAMSIPLPIVAIGGNRKALHSYDIKGVYVHDAPQAWVVKQQRAQQRFDALSGGADEASSKG